MTSFYTWTATERKLAYLVDTGCGRSVLLSYLAEAQVADPEQTIDAHVESCFLVEVEPRHYKVTAWMGKG